MKTAPRSFRRVSAGSLLALLCHCGSSQTAHSTMPVATAGRAPAPRPAAMPIDLSEVPQPPQVVAVARIASWNAIVERVAAVAGLGDLARTAANEMATEMLHDLAPAVDRDGPVDIVVTLAPGAGHDVNVAFALNTASVDDLERQLSSAFRFTSVGNGVSRLDAVESNGASSQRPHASGLQCYAAPSPNPRVGRLVCSEHAAVLEGVTPFLARTLPRHAPAPDSLAIDVSAAPLRDAFLQDAVHEIATQRDRFDRTVATSTEITDPAARQAMTSLVHDALDALQGMMTDPTALHMAFTLTPERLTVHFGADMQNPTQSLLRALVEAGLHAQPVPTSVLSHLLPGAWVYEAVSADSRPLRTVVTQIVEIGNQLIAHEHGLDAADRAALQAALASMEHIDQETAGVAIGNDADGRFWLAGASHAATITPASQIADLRALVAALRRPHIARIFQSQVRNAAGQTTPHDRAREIDLAQLRELPTRGLPAGSYALEIPAFEHLLTPPSGASPAPTGVPHHAAPLGRLQVALVPEGGDTVMLMGMHVVDLYNRYHSNTTPGIDPALLNAPSMAVVAAFVPAAFPNLMRASSPHDADEMAANLQALPDHGATPIWLRAGMSQADGVTHLSEDFEISASSLRNFINLANHPVHTPPAVVPTATHTPAASVRHGAGVPPAPHHGH